MDENELVSLSEIPVGGHIRRKSSKHDGPETAICEVVHRQDDLTWLRMVAPASYGDDNKFKAEEDLEVYPVDASKGVCTVRLFDKYDGYWIDCLSNCSLEEAQAYLEKETRGGREYTKYSDGAYYKIFPAATRMIFDGR